MQNKVIFALNEGVWLKTIESRNNGKEGNKICFSNWVELEGAINHFGCYSKNTCKVPLFGKG